MNKELTNVQHPRRARWRWVLFYSIVALIAITALVLWAQSLRSYRQPTGSMSLHVPYATYLVGEPITFTLKNNYDTTIYLPNTCPSEPLAVYKQEDDDDWERIHATTSKENCPNTDRTIAIEPGDKQSGSYAKWASLFKTPGTYRVAAIIDYFGVVSYQDFTVITPPEPKIITRVERQDVSGQLEADDLREAPASDITSFSEKTISTANGSVAVRYSTTTIYVTSVTPASGCSYEGGGSGPQVEIEFKCSGTELQVKLWLSNGQLLQKIEVDD